jgi:hypothetical protein
VPWLAPTRPSVIGNGPLRTFRRGFERGSSTIGIGWRDLPRTQTATIFSSSRMPIRSTSMPSTSVGRHRQSGPQTSWRTGCLLGFVVPINCRFLDARLELRGRRSLSNSRVCCWPGCARHDSPRFVPIKARESTFVPAGARGVPPRYECVRPARNHSAPLGHEARATGSDL